MISTASSPDERLAAFSYFLTSVVFLGICFVTYFIFVRQPLYQHYQREYLLKRLEKSRETVARDSECSEQRPTAKLTGKGEKRRIDWQQLWITIKTEGKKYLGIAKQCWQQLFNVFFLYLVSLAMFPAVCAGGELITRCKLEG